MPSNVTYDSGSYPQQEATDTKIKLRNITDGELAEGKWVDAWIPAGDVG